jgi:hypothetical protein
MTTSVEEALRWIFGFAFLVPGLWLLVGCASNPYYAKSSFHSLAVAHQTAIAYVTIPCDDNNCGKKPDK